MKYRLFVLSTLAIALNACGGGGGTPPAGSNNGSQTSGNSTSSGSAASSSNSNITQSGGTGSTDTTSANNSTGNLSNTATSNSHATTSALATGIDIDTMSFASALDVSNTHRQIATPASASFTLQSISVDQGTTQNYQISIDGGSVPNAVFYSPLALSPAAGNATSFEQDFGTYKTTQYNAILVPSAYPSTAYGVSIQSLAQDGFSYVGMGHWKYFGYQQSGYFSGNTIALGSFLIGTPTLSTSVANIPSSTYTGYSQAGIEALPYADNFDELRMSVDVAYDKTAGTVTITLKDLEYWWSYGMASQYQAIQSASKFSQYPSSSLYLPASLQCTTTIDPSTNAFTCAMGEATSTYYGTFKGKFFGPNGSEIGGTFAIKGLFVDFGNVTAGAFVAKSN